MTLEKLDPKLICFDLDGTLIDTMQSYADVAADLLSVRHGMNRAEARQRYLETCGLPFVGQVDLIVGRNDLNKNLETVEIFEEKKLEATKGVRMEQFDKDVLQALKNKGYRLAISSNNTQENVDRFIRQEALQDVPGLGFVSGGHAKGEEHFAYLSEVTSVPRDRMLFVADGLKDAEIAQKCRVDFVGKLGTFRREDFETKGVSYIIAQLKDLLDLLA